MSGWVGGWVGGWGYLVSSGFPGGRDEERTEIEEVGERG